MATQPKTDLRRFGIDKKRIQQIVAEQNEKMGFVPDPTATHEKVREMMLALGIRPEDNIGSRLIISGRYPEDYEENI